MIILFVKAVKEIQQAQNGNLLPKIMAMVIFFVDQNLKKNSLSEIIDIKKLRMWTNQLRLQMGFQMSATLVKII